MVNVRRLSPPFFVVVPPLGRSCTYYSGLHHGPLHGPSPIFPRRSPPSCGPKGSPKPVVRGPTPAFVGPRPPFPPPTEGASPKGGARVSLRPPPKGWGTFFPRPRRDSPFTKAPGPPGDSLRKAPWGQKFVSPKPWPRPGPLLGFPTQTPFPRIARTPNPTPLPELPGPCLVRLPPRSLYPGEFPRTLGQPHILRPPLGPRGKPRPRLVNPGVPPRKFPRSLGNPFSSLRTQNWPRNSPTGPPSAPTLV